MNAKQFLKEKVISNSDFMDSGVADLIETLLTEYQALQLQQTGVSNRLLSEKIILALDDYGRKTHKVEYGLPIDPDTKDFEDKRPQEMLKIVIDILNGC